MDETMGYGHLEPDEVENLKIGARLRAARKGSGLTLEQLAQATNLSRAFLSRVENDTALPRLPTLIAICKALALPVGSLFTAAEESLVRADDVLPLVPVAGGEVVEWLLTPSSEAIVQLIRASYPPGGGSGGELHEIDAEVEVAHVQRGRLVVSFATGEVELKEGDTLTFRAREPHGWRNPDPRTTTDVLWVIAPAPWGLRRRAAEAEATQSELAAIQGAH
ncbi:helix-turn-helix domain-containing protein [Pseudarthrobacter sp. NPDC055928]|uniref:helix-turn-helix domain-containing protein n=1 Tax=Pseudarthrobacter sp. NPDC055928 TaxID=3345661 RepID=UPI0035E213C5